MWGIRSNRLADGVMKKVVCDNKSCGDHFNDRFAMCEKLTKCIDRSAALRHLTFAICKTRRGHGCRKRASIFPFPFASKLCHLQCVCILMCTMCMYLYRYMYSVYLWVHGRQKAPRFRDLDLGRVRVRVLRIRYPRLGTWFWGPLVSGRRNLGAARDLHVIMGQISPNINLNIGTQNIWSHVSCYLMDEIRLSCKYGLERG